MEMESVQSNAMDEGQDESLSGSELDVPGVDDQPFDVSKNLECSYCNRVFTSRRQMLVHQWTHKERQEYMCQVCDKPISNENAFRKHMVMHFKDYSRHVRCKICQKVFRTPRAMEEHHEKYHRGQKPFVCTTCGLSFSWRDNLFKHERVHVEKPFACLVCHESFRDVNALNQHIRQHRRAQKSGEKDKVMLMPKQQELHYKPLLSTNGSQQAPPDDDLDDKDFKCEVCGMSFMYSFTLEAHMKGHGENKVAIVTTDTKKKSSSKSVDKPHVCVICGEKFRWDFCLDAHLKIHQQRIIGGQVFLGLNRVPKPVNTVTEASNCYRSIPSSKKLLMLVNSMKDDKGKPVASVAPASSNSQSQLLSTSIRKDSTVSSSSTSVQQFSPTSFSGFQARAAETSGAPDDLEPGEIRLDHLIDMAVDEDNWEPMVPKPDPVLPITDPDLNKAKKKARMIRVEQVPLEGRKKATVVKKLGHSDGDHSDEDKQDEDEPVVTAFTAPKSKRGAAAGASAQAKSGANEIEFDELMNLTESESESGSDFESELKGRTKKRPKNVPKRKIKTEKVDEDEYASPPPVKSKRGRPPKDAVGTKHTTKTQNVVERMEQAHKKRPTRLNQTNEATPAASTISPTGKRRGRPPKIKEEKLDADMSTPLAQESGRTTRNSLNRKARMEADAQIQKILKSNAPDSEDESPTVPSTSKTKAPLTKPDTPPIAKVSKLKVYSCDLCKKAFTKRTALLAHRLFAHKGVKRSALQHSGIEMIQHRALLNKADHLIRRASIRQSQVRPYECMECGKTFSQQAYLTFHEESHDNISRTYTCHQCDLTMYSWLQCIQHQMLHRKSAR